jgi:hypothetical protein
VQVRVEEDLVVMGMLADRRDELGRARTQVISRLHRLLLELLPGGAKKFLSAQQARALVATVRPRDIAGRTRRQLVSELISELAAIDKKIKAANAQLTALVAVTGSSLPGRRQQRKGLRCEPGRTWFTAAQTVLPALFPLRSISSMARAVELAARPDFAGAVAKDQPPGTRRTSQPGAGWIASAGRSRLRRLSLLVQHPAQR